MLPGRTTGSALVCNVIMSWDTAEFHTNEFYAKKLSGQSPWGFPITMNWGHSPLENKNFTESNLLKGNSWYEIWTYTINFHDFRSQTFKLRVSNPRFPQNYIQIQRIQHFSQEMLVMKAFFEQTQLWLIQLPHLVIQTRSRQSGNWGAQVGMKKGNVDSI